MKLSLRARFALLAGILVFAVASLAALGGYLAMRTSLLHRAARTAQSQAAQVATMVDVSAPTGSQDAAGAQTNNQGNTVDINDPALTHLRGVPGTLIDVRRKDGTLIQASSTVLLPSAFSRRCLSSGHAQMRLDQPPLALACQRAGPSSGTLGGLITVGAPLADAFASLRTLRTVLIFGVLSGALLSAGLALIVARRALRPVRRIAETAETIRGGDLARRIGYQGSDELGRLAAVLDACFDELEQALERQRRFGADASHELRTPIAAIRANVELLRGWAGADPVARQAAIASLDQASRRAARLVEDLLFLARLEREPPAAHAPVALDDLVLAVVREAGQLRPDVSIHVTRLDEATIEGDELRLQQLLLNLLDNALRVSPAGGSVTVDLTAHTGTATIAISDEGPGIEPEELARIFDRLYSRRQLHDERAGSGLGLAIARAIAHDHGGELTARNDRHRGAILTVTLPLRRRELASGVLNTADALDA